MKKISLIFLLFLLIPFVTAKQGHMKLLAVKETPTGYEGSSADLYLEIKPGNGRVFLDTFPLTKVDTQISTRFARDVACDYLDIDCNNHDFFYTINADSSIIGGPSAGASIAVLTIAMLKNLQLDENVAITGTINSGGIIGPIGGVKAKIDAAKISGVKKIIIPSGERFLKKEELTNKTLNKSIDLVEYGRQIGIEVIEAPNLDVVLDIFTAQRVKVKHGAESIEIDKLYTDTMKRLSIELCNRSKALDSIVSGLSTALTRNESNITLSSANELYSKGIEAYNSSIYYASASYCFGANVRLGYLSFLRQNITNNSIKIVYDTIKDTINSLNNKLNSKEVKTIGDLEAYMVAKERLVEAEQLLEKANSGINDKEKLYNLAFASERAYSAISWLSFFDHRGKFFNFNRASLENSCKKKLSEVEEQFQYIGTIIPLDISNIREGLDSAYDDLENRSHELCLFKASKAKAEISTVLSGISVDESQIDNFISQKLKIIKSNIAEDSKKGIFPILGYSYYEYADSLKDSDKYSALLYSEYALELGNLDIYFKDKHRVYLYNFDNGMIGVVIVTAIVAFVLGLILAKRYYKAKKARKRKNDRKDYI